MKLHGCPQYKQSFAVSLLCLLEWESLVHPNSMGFTVATDGGATGLGIGGSAVGPLNLFGIIGETT